MKSKKLLIFTLFFLGVGHVKADNDRIVGTLRKIEEVSLSKNQTSAIEILKGLDVPGIWSFGAGLGPTTNDSLRIMAIEALWPIFLDVGSSERGGDMPVYLKDIKIMVEGDDSRLKMNLESSDPSTRLVALLALSRIDKLSSKLTASLKVVATKDQYFQIERAADPEIDKSRPPQPGNVVHVVSAPLRKRAEAELVKRGMRDDESSNVNNDQAAYWLAKLLLNEKLPFDEVCYAIVQLDNTAGPVSELRSTVASGKKEDIMRDASKAVEKLKSNESTPSGQ